MQFVFYSGETEIGEAHFHGSDPPMGCALFHLVPNDNYLAFQPVFQLAMSSGWSPELQKQAAEMSLTIRDEEGNTLTAQGITVNDAQAEMPDEPIEVWLLGMDRFGHYFPGEYERYEAYFTNRRQS